MNFYLSCVVVNLVFWAFRSMHEKHQMDEFTWPNYLFGFALCFVPVVNIVTGWFFVQYAIGNIKWLHGVDWLLQPLDRLLFIPLAMYDSYETNVKRT